MKNWFDKLTGHKTNDDGQAPDLKEAAHSILDGLIQKVSSPTHKQTFVDRLKKFDKKSQEKRLEELLPFYLSLEQYITELDPAASYTRVSLRKKVKNDHPQVLGIKGFDIVFSDRLAQSFELTRQFLSKIVGKSFNILGATGDNQLKELEQWLLGLPSPQVELVPYYPSEKMPDTTEGWFKLLCKISRSLYQDIEGRFSEQFAQNIFESGYDELEKAYKNLEGFSSVISALPEVILDESKINILSKDQIQKVLLDQVKSLEEFNNEIEEKNRQLEVAQHDLKDSQRRAVNALDELNSVMQAVAEAILMIDQTGKIVMANREATQIFGYTIEELGSMKVTSLLPARYGQQYQHETRAYLENGESQIMGRRLEWAGLRNGGSEFPLGITITALAKEGESFFTAACRDISEEVKREEQVRTLARFPEENPDPVLRVSQYGEVLYCNASGKLFQFYWSDSTEEFNISDQFRVFFGNVFIGGTRIEEEAYFGTRHYAVTYAPVTEEGYINVYAIDITQRKEAERLVVEQNKNITSSIVYAKRIQNALLKNPAELTNHFDGFILHRPRDIVSGDIYWWEQVGDKWVVAVLDCTGHGVPGAFMSIIANDLMKEIVFWKKITRPDLILKELDKGIKDTLRQSRSGNRDGLDASICMIDPAQHKLFFSGAKNSLVYTQNGELNTVKGSQHIIGELYKEIDKDFSLHEINIGSDTQFYLFSDGFQDQFGGKDKRKYLSKNFRAFLYSIHDQPMARQKELLHEEFDRWCALGNEKQIDDVLVMGLRVGQ